jgi:hypothetical protein
MAELEPTGREGSSPRSVESTHRALPWSRVIALAVLAVLIFGLASIRLTSGATPVSLPPGAKAGDLTLQPCRYPTEQGSSAADCGTLVVPESGSDPRSRLIALPVMRIRAQSAHPGAPIFYLEGGPGMTKMEFKRASRFAGDHDVVLVGYRGVDGSVRLD